MLDLSPFAVLITGDSLLESNTIILYVILTVINRV